MSVQIKQWRNDVMSRLRGADSAIVDAEIRRACILWCEIARKPRVTLPAIDLVAGTASYTPVAPMLDVPGDRVVSAIWSVRLSTEADPLVQQDEDSLDALAPGWRNGTYSNSVPEWYRLTNTTITLIPAPSTSTTGGLLVEVVLAPSDTAEAVEDEMYRRQRNRQTIEARALSELYSMHTKPWHNPAEAVRMRAEWESGLGTADVDGARGYGRGLRRTRPVYR